MIREHNDIKRWVCDYCYITVGIEENGLFDATTEFCLHKRCAWKLLIPTLKKLVDQKPTK